MGRYLGERESCLIWDLVGASVARQLPQVVGGHGMTWGTKGREREKEIEGGEEGEERKRTREEKRIY